MGPWHCAYRVWCINQPAWCMVYTVLQRDTSTWLGNLLPRRGGMARAELDHWTVESSGPTFEFFIPPSMMLLVYNKPWSFSKWYIYIILKSTELIICIRMTKGPVLVTLPPQENRWHWKMKQLRERTTVCSFQMVVSLASMHQCFKRANKQTKTQTPQGFVWDWDLWCTLW